MSEGNVQFSSGSSLLNHPINLSAGLHGPPPNLLAGSFPVNQGSNSATINSGAINPAQPQAPSVLKVTNLPPDLTPREANLIFSLVNEDIINVELKDYTVTALFKSLNTCVTTGKLLDGRYIFGSNYPPVKAEYDNNLNLGSTNAAFDNLRLSNVGISPPSTHQLPQQNPAPGASAPNGAPALDNFQKRTSIGNQRSRFLFSDPFSGATTPTNPAPGSIDLSDLTGKSLLLMKSQNDGRDYEPMPRDPWGSQGSNSMGFGSNPQTPGLAAVPNAYDWGSSGVANAQNTQSSQNQQQQVGQDRRRKSTFFNGSVSTQGGVGPQGSNQQSPVTSQPQPSTSQSQSAQVSPVDSQSQQPGGAAQQPPAQQPQTVAAIISQGPTSQANGSLPALNIPSANSARPTSAQGAASQPASATTPTSSTTPSSTARSMSKDVPDLSLLARVPPPANPADQNPPCNTLYVGNLPPDATEAELRSLFSPQKGFRRLSFRTKNQSSSSSGGSASHNHGPMCFVEFEDVAHATVALAELYGRALPRPNGSNGKGGIRLSFSKNPLGVRGPGNPRRTSANSQQTTSGSASNGVGNYGYSNYH